MTHLPHKKRTCRECGRTLCEGERLLCVGCSVEKPPRVEEPYDRDGYGSGSDGW